MDGRVERALVAVWAAFLVGWMVGPLREIWPLGREMLAVGWAPLTPAGLGVALGRHGAVLGLAGAMAVALWLAGGPVFRWSGARPTAGLRGWAVYPLGYAAVSTLSLGLALVKLWFPALLVLGLVLPALAAFTLTPRPGLRPDAFGTSFPGSVGWLPAAAVLVLQLPWLLAPESQRDGWEYFLVGPERWLAVHGFSSFAATPPLNCPNLAEMLYGIPVALGLDQVPKWLNALALVCGVAAAAERWRPGSAGWVLLLIVTSASGTWMMTTGKHDGFCAGFILLAFAAAWGAPGRRRALSAGEALGGVCAGLALCTKYLSLVNIAILPLLLFTPVAGAPLRPRAALGWGLLALGVAAPWYARSLLLTGDPLYPVLAGYFPWLVDGWDQRNRELGQRCYHVAMPAIPVLVRWLDGIVREHAAVALLLPALVLGGGPARGVALAALGMHLVWFGVFYSPQTQRWGFPGFAPAFVIAGASLPDWLNGSPIRRWAAIACLAAGTLHGLSRTVYTPNPVPVALGMESAATYRGRAITTRVPLDAYLSRSPSGRALLLLGDTREYRLPKPVRVGSAYFSGEAPLLWRLAEACGSDRDFLVKFRQLNVERMIYNPITAINNGALFQPFGWTPAMTGRWRGCFSRWWELELSPQSSDHTNGLYYLYRLRRTPRPAPSVLLHLPGTESISAEAMDHAGALPPDQSLHRAYAREMDLRVPNVLLYRDQAAFLAREEGADAEAYALYRPGIRAGLIDDENLPGFGVVALRTGRFAEALATFERTAQIYPDWRVLMEDYAARARYEIALHLMPTDPAAADLVLTEGLARLARSVQRGGQPGPTGLLRLARGYARFQLGRPAEGMEDLNAAATVISGVATTPLARLPELLSQAEREILITTGAEQRLAALRRPERSEGLAALRRPAARPGISSTQRLDRRRDVPRQF